MPVMALLATSSTGEAERGRSLGLAGLARLMSVGPMSNHVSESKVEVWGCDVSQQEPFPTNAKGNDDAMVRLGGPEERVREPLLWELFLQVELEVHTLTPKNRVTG